MKPKIFIDGQVGTTGLMINERLEKRDDIEIISIDHDKRKDQEEKRKLVNQADIVFLCLPDQAAKESASLLENDRTRIIDASTAHRTDKNWTYGFAEIKKNQRDKIAKSQLLTNPGCHATGFIAAMAPLVERGIVDPSSELTCQSLSGYSGAGKKLIEKYNEASWESDFKQGPHHYALGLAHKHLPEMMSQCGLTKAPLFLPMVGPFYKGMVVTVPLFLSQLKGINTAKDIHSHLQGFYQDEACIRVLPFGDQEDFADGVFFHPQGCNNTNRLDLFVYGHDDQAVIVSRLDNLGKGASGAAVQNMNIMLGLDELTGLTTGLNK